jgi:hypothetical protein
MGAAAAAAVHVAGCGSMCLVWLLGIGVGCLVQEGFAAKLGCLLPVFCRLVEMKMP